MFRLLKLTPADWLGLLTAMRYLLIAGWALKTRRAHVAQRLTQIEPPAPASGSSGDNEFPQRAARYIDLASRHPVRWARCLQRSLALCLWLEARGYSSAIRIGVRMTGSGLEAHAWVEYRGGVLNDSEVVESTFPRLRKTQRT